MCDYTPLTLGLGLVGLLLTVANAFFWARRAGYWARVSARLQFAKRAGEVSAEISDQSHPERLAVLPYCVGRGIDVGCGFRKTSENCIGVDIVSRGQLGKVGCVAGRASVADICASGDYLPMFDDGELDFVVARHNLEHYVDVVKTLLEWKRILKIGGVMAIVLPDETARDTIALDTSHKHAFTPESFQRLVNVLGGLSVETVAVAVPNWSFMCVCRKAGS